MLGCIECDEKRKQNIWERKEVRRRSAVGEKKKNTKLTRNIEKC